MLSSLRTVRLVAKARLLEVWLSFYYNIARLVNRSAMTVPSLSVLEERNNTASERQKSTSSDKLSGRRL